jgi:membrane associated rhomboid family serine protease
VANRFQLALPEPRPRDGWFRVGNLDITTTALLVLAGVASMFVYAFDKVTFYKLSFQPLLVRDGELWRLITWPLANQPSIWVVITLLFFWIIGHGVEGMVGRVRYTVLVAVTTVVPAAIVTLLPPDDFPTAPAAGLRILGTAMFVVFAAENPNMPFFFGVPAWVIAAVFIGIDVLQLVGDRYWGTLVLELAAVVVAIVVVRQWGFVRRLSFIPKVGGSKGKPPRRAPVNRRGPERRPADKRGSVVEGPWSAPVPPRSSADAVAAQVELDELLDKISASGLDSLSSDEKRRLNELSKRLR